MPSPERCTNAPIAGLVVLKERDVLLSPGVIVAAVPAPEMCPVLFKNACNQGPVPTWYFTNTHAASQLEGPAGRRQEFSHVRLNCTIVKSETVLCPVRVILESKMLLAIEFWTIDNTRNRVIFFRMMVNNL